MSGSPRSSKSTNVRFSPPAWLRLGMQGLEAVWPPLATRVAERLLLTPMRHPTPNRERPLREAARVLSLPWWPRGQRLAGYAWGSGPPVLLVHGWAGRATQLGAFVPPLVAAGHSVIGFDLPAHGRSDGEQTSLLDFRDALIEIGRAHGPFAAVIGHSMGAAAVTLACAQGLLADRLVLVATPASLRDQTLRFATSIGLSEDVYRRVTARLENRTRTRFEQVEVERIAPQIVAPALVVHDEGDDEVPIEAGVRVARALPRARLLRTVELGHRKILRAPSVIGEVTRFITDSGWALGPDADPVGVPDDPPDEPIERELFDREARVRRRT